MGRSVADAGCGLVYGGGCVGLMGVLADAALAAGGEVIGVIPAAMLEWEVGHPGVTSLEVVQTMHERKARMAELSDGFIAMPGAYGTLEEFFEVLTWLQLGFHSKPVAILNVAGFFDPLLAMLDRLVDEGFLRSEDRGLVMVEHTPEAVLERMRAFAPLPAWGREKLDLT
jgi:uncharacterized protein (TIGR00730 family)